MIMVLYRIISVVMGTVLLSTFKWLSCLLNDPTIDPRQSLQLPHRHTHMVLVRIWGDGLLPAPTGPPPPESNVINLVITFPKAFPLGEGGLPRSGKTDEVPGGWFRAFIITEAQSIMSGDLISHGKAVTASPKGKPFGGASSLS